MTTLLLVPDGVGVRNFVLGSFLRHLTRESDVTVLHAIPPELVARYAPGIDETRVRWQQLAPYVETPVAATLRYSLAYAQMNWVNTKSMRFNATRPIQGSWRTRAMHKAARAIGRTTAFPLAIRALERGHCRAVESAAAGHDYDRLFGTLRPSVLFCSHQRPPVILPAVLAARRAGIPTATFIFSWDNLSSKGRIAAPFDHYLVWSRAMRNELLQYYPDVPGDRVHIVGTPQFDPYGDEAVRLPREAFFASIGADPNRPLICYSGGDTGNCPQDHLHLKVLLELIRSGRIGHRPQVVLRPSPADEGTRYDELRREYPELIYQPPQWIHTQPGNWAHVFPLPADVPMLANLAAHADLNVNFGSTMTLDFSLHDKPVVIPTFDLITPFVFGMSLYDFCLQFEHYRPVAELGAARFARSPEQFADYINAYLNDPTLDRAGRRQLVDLQVHEAPGLASRRIVDVLQQIAGGWRGVSPESAREPMGQVA